MLKPFTLVIAALLITQNIALLAGERRKVQRVSIWDGDQLVRFDPTAGDAAWILGKKGILRKVPMPKKLSLYIVDYFEGALWANRIVGDGIEVWKHAGETWEKVAEWPPSPETRYTPTRILPLAENRFLGLTCTPLFQEQGRYSPAAILQLKSETTTLVVREIVEVGFETRIIDKDPLKSHPALSHRFFMPRITRVGGRLVLPMEQPGIFCIFDGNTGRHRRNIFLFSDLSEKELLKNHPLNALLGYQPTQDGDLIFAARSRDAVLQGHVFKTEGPKFTGNPNNDGKFWDNKKKDEDFLNTIFDQITWYALDPQSGKIRDIAPPPGAHLSTKTMPAPDFNWRIQWNGSISYSTSKEIYDLECRRDADYFLNSGEEMPDYLREYLTPEEKAKLQGNRKKTE